MAVAVGFPTFSRFSLPRPPVNPAGNRPFQASVVESKPP